MYRVRVVPLFLPPLAERTGDVEALTWHFSTCSSPRRAPPDRAHRAVA
jgi:transcriptional regulator with GAF, ATPase, and Fis domain